MRWVVFAIFMVAYCSPLHAGVVLQKSNLEYKGAFRVPKGNLGGDSVYSDTLSRGGAGLAFNTANGSLFITTRSSGAYPEKLVTEITIPAVVDSNEMASLNTATVVQVPGDVANSKWQYVKNDNTATGNDVSVGGLLVHNNKLIGSAFAYYDGPSESFRSHFTASTTWTVSGIQFNGMRKVGTWPSNASLANGGVVGGYMATVPSEWATQLGYPAITGKGAVAVISRSSQGPAIWGFDPDNLATQDPVTATMFVGYIDDHAPLGNYTYGGLPYNAGADYGGAAFPVGSDSILIFGRKGYGNDGQGESCYGHSTSIEAQHNTNVCGMYNNEKCCYDLTKTGHGNHAYPYTYSLLMYNANDLKKVKDGVTNPATGQPWQPHEVLPYADIDLDSDWGVSVSDDKGMKTIGGVAYDPATQRIYISQSEADTAYNQYEPYPLIRVYQVNVGASGNRYRLRIQE